MRRTTSIVLAAAVAGAGSGVAAAAAPVGDASAAVRTGTGTGLKTVRYGPHQRQKMDIYTPGSAVGKVGLRLGTVVLVHGGAWIKGDKSDFVPQARQLARQGYVVANINYRFATDAAWPAPRHDTVNAVKYLRSHARPLNVDNDRIVLIGSSAGAHLAAAAATLRRGSSLVSGVIGLSGPLGMRRVAADPAHNLDRIVTDLLLRCSPSECAGRYISASPRYRLSPGDVPSLMVASPGDFVDPRNSVDFVARARSVGLKARMLWIPGDLHGRHLWDQAWPTVRPWLGARMANQARH